jgi:hypothetical protein
MSPIDHAPTRPDRVHVTPLRARAYALVFAAALAGAILTSSPWIPLALLVPDLSLLTSMASLKDGRLDRRAVRAYNAAHHLPSAIAAVAVGVLVPAVLPFALLWLAHIAMDRAFGYGPRAADGSQRGY